MKKSLFFSLFITCLSICRSDKANGWKLTECESCPRRMGNVTFSSFFIIKRRMFIVRKTLFFLVAPRPDFSFIYIIDIVTHNLNPLFLRLVIVICCYYFSFTFLIDEIYSLILPLMICLNTHTHIFKTREEKKRVKYK
jgi:hypothetical protein